MEFLVFITIDREGVGAQQLQDLVAAESRRAAELVADGTIVRLWRPAEGGGLWRNIGIWNARSIEELSTVIGSLPLFPWMTTQITELSEHPSDPLRSNEGEKV